MLIQEIQEYIRLQETTTFSGRLLSLLLLASLFVTNVAAANVESEGLNVNHTVEFLSPLESDVPPISVNDSTLLNALVDHVVNTDGNVIVSEFTVEGTSKSNNLKLSDDQYILHWDTKGTVEDHNYRIIVYIKGSVGYALSDIEDAFESIGEDIGDFFEDVGDWFGL